MSQHTVDVSGRHYVVQVYQHANNVWIAAGVFLGDQLRTRGSTAKKAVRAWQKAAVYHVTTKDLFGAKLRRSNRTSFHCLRGA
jgi:hypothetical protein